MYQIEILEFEWLKLRRAGDIHCEYRNDL